MAMLVLPAVLKRSLGIRAQAFSPKAIGKLRLQHPAFL